MSKTLRGHVLHECVDPTEYDACYVCSGGLADCTVCRGAEGAMPTDCPGVALTGAQLDDVYAGKIDFVGGCWTVGRTVR